ncbi:sel1 repeat family protein [Asticcacaulis biprosthecium C19]|uniref:Sel1 repeat family protein n=1 Tax=Asticcacaulis biprosthecium C19 TaxID=715226 RepID=F4QU75_9CAUL|nr:tetratricopeptide repeat protein [Asticcacaulis biprosthecium]EGF89375.1 sel1 repeat family protein [Asticcacaulis biprosthecium C19]
MRYPIKAILISVVAALTLALPGLAQAADGYMGCYAHRSDTNRVLWTSRLSAGEGDKATVAAAFLRYLQGKNLMPDQSLVTAYCVWNRDAATSDSELQRRVKAFPNSNNMGLSFDWPPEVKAAPGPAPAAVSPVASAAPDTSETEGLKAACLAGDAKSCMGYAYRMEVGYYGNTQDASMKNPWEAVAYYRDACRLGEGVGCRNFALMKTRGGVVPINYDDAFVFYDKGCNLNDPFSCFALGAAYATGQGTSVDNEKAVVAYRKACDLNEGGACNNLAWMTETGAGTAKDKTLSLNLYTKACDLGDANACANFKRLKTS